MGSMCIAKYKRSAGNCSSLSARKMRHNCVGDSPFMQRYCRKEAYVAAPVAPCQLPVNVCIPADIASYQTRQNTEVNCYMISPIKKQYPCLDTACTLIRVE